MPDAFFVNDRKRKQPSSSSRGGSSSRGRGRGGGSFGASGSGGGRPASSGSKRPQPTISGSRNARPRHRKEDEVLSSASEGEGEDLDDLDLRAGRGGDPDLFEGENSEEEEFRRNETAGQKRLRLAKGYLEKVRGDLEREQKENEEGGFFDAEEVDRDLIAARLQEDADEVSGRIYSFISSTLPESPSHRFIPSFASHTLTSAALSPSYLFTANKKGTVVPYALSTFEISASPFGQNGRSGLPDPSPETSAKKGKGKIGGKKQIVSVAEAVKVTGHKGEILCLATSEDGRYLLTGGRDRMIGVWEIGSASRKPTSAAKDDTNGKAVQGKEGQISWLRALPGHKDAVTSIAIPALGNSSHHVLSVSLSRHLCLHSLSTLSLIETFFGHQDSITSVSSLKPTLAVTSGARDRTCRWWKVEEEIQLVFRGGGKSVYKKEQQQEKLDGNGDVNMESTGAKETAVVKPKKGKKEGKGLEFFEGSVDTVCMLDDSHFISGGDTGSVCLWHTGRKKPVFSFHLAHGVETHHSETEGEIIQPRWITSIAALRGTDIFATGSWDGQIRLWAIAPTLKSFSPLYSIPAHGFVNSLQILSIPAENVGSFDSKTVDADADAVAAPRAKAKHLNILAAALSQEPRLGRWSRDPKAKNGTLLVNLTRG